MEKRIRHIGIIGSTGSIGTQTLDIVRSNDDLKVEILSCAGNNLDLFEKQVREFMPKKVCVWQEAAAKDFADRIKDLQVHHFEFPVSGKVLTGVNSIFCGISGNFIDCREKYCFNGIGMIHYEPP